MMHSVFNKNSATLCALLTAFKPLHSLVYISYNTHSTYSVNPIYKSTLTHVTKSEKRGTPSNNTALFTSNTIVGDIRYQHTLFKKVALVYHSIINIF